MSHRRVRPPVRRSPAKFRLSAHDKQMIVEMYEDLSHEHQLVILKHLVALGSEEIRDRDAAAGVIHGAAALALAMTKESRNGI